MKKLSKRLQKIDGMITSHYHSIWDCCCDHGLLGLTLLKRIAADNIHFVDIVPSLTNQLELLLKAHFNSSQFAPHWQVHCIDVAKLPLNLQGKQLVIIAGVGGELAIEFIHQISSVFQKSLPLNSKDELEFILCPVHHNYQVRQTLRQQNFTLIDECIVTENKRFYEILHVKTQFSVKSTNAKEFHIVSAIGNEMWDLSSKEHLYYLTKTLNHYQRILLATKAPDQKYIQKIIQEYSSLKLLFK